MFDKPTYEELERRVMEFEKEAVERTQDGQALMESEEKYRQLFENTTLGIGIASDKGELIVFNDAMLKPGGYSREDISEINNITELYYNSDERKKILDIAKKQGFVDEIEVQFRRKDGTPYDAVLSLKSVQIKGESCWQAMVQDVTERKLANKALKESEFKYKALVQNIPGMVYRGYADWSAEIISGSEEICGYTNKELNSEKENWLSIIHSDDKAGVFREGSELAKRKQSTVQTYRIVTKGGDIRWVEDRKTSLFSEEGEFIGIDGIVFDITERKQAEERLLQESTMRGVLLDNLPCVALILKKGTREIVASNQAAKQIGAVPGKTCYETCAQRDDDCPFCLAPKLWTTGDPQHLEVEYRGTYYEGIWVPLTDELYVHYIFDITNRKHAENTLKESEEKYRELVERTDDLITRVDKEGKFIFVNHMSHKIFGLSPQDCVGMLAFDFTHPDDKELTRKWFDDIVAMHKTSGTIENRQVSQNGEVYHMLWTSNFHYDSYDNLIGVNGIARDITERKQAEEALRESEAFTKAVMDNLPIGIAVNSVDPAVEFDYMNDNFPKFYRTTREKLADPDAFWSSVYEETEFREEIKKRVLHDCASGDPERMYWIEVPITRKGDETFFITARNIPIPDKQLMISTVWDVTDHKRADEALSESEEKYRKLVENANDAIFIIQDGMVKFPNSKVEDVTGYSIDELTKIPFENIIHPEDRNMVLERRRNRLMGEKPPPTYIFRLINKSGEKLWVQINTAFITWEGKPATINFIRDITDHKRLEAQLQQSQRMESLGTLAGGIAHDFNNLLMGIYGRTSLMLMDTDSSHPHLEHLNGIEDNVKSATNLTKQLLGFARGGKYEVRPTDLNELIKNQNLMFGRTKKEITIREKYEKDLWTVEVDRGQIEQVLLNLYVNAWHAMPGSGDLYTQTENMTLDENYLKPFEIEPGKYVKISVTDNGIGMDEATQQRIFDPFFTTKEMDRGTGLGLASAYGIIKNHGGFINVYSEKGEGTTFNIYLPASEKEVIKETEIKKEVLTGSETVLLVDDEETVINVARSMLEKLGYKVLIAGGGKEAIEIYQANKDKIDIVILDMIMPEMGGGNTYDRLKEINPVLKVLLSSGYSINGQATEILNRGCNGFIQKPFSMKDLSQKIMSVLDKD
jgi:PAS domain S-box-containing protein